MKYVVTSKPVIACIWGRNDPPFFEQVGVCKEFNIPMGFHFTGSYSLWKHSIGPDIVQSRQWLFEVADDAHKIDTSKLPLPSANHSTGSKIKVKRYRRNYKYGEDFSRERFIDEATIEGFLNLRWDGEKEVLFIEPKGKKSSVNLTYHFVSEFDFEISKIESRLSGQMKDASEVELSLSLDGQQWKHIVKAKGERGTTPQSFAITSSAAQDKRFKGKELWARISGEVSPEKESFILLDTFQITAQVAPPKNQQTFSESDEKGNYATWQGLKKSIRKDPSCTLLLHL